MKIEVAPDPRADRRTHVSVMSWSQLLHELRRQVETYVDPQFYTERDAVELAELSDEVSRRASEASQERAAIAASHDDDGC